MPIEFRCSQCGKLLRTGDDTAGRQAQCPACGTISTVPAAERPPEAAPPEPSSPFATTAPHGEPPTSPFASTGADDADNPYQAPGEYAPAEAYPGAFAADRVAAPAIGLIVTGSLGLAFQMLGLAGNLISFGMQRPGQGGDAFMMIGAQVAGAALGVALSILVIFAGVKMKNLENYGLSMAGAIVAMIPCFGPCCLLGIPIGIWAIVVLVSPEVKAAFR